MLLRFVVQIFTLPDPIFTTLIVYLQDMRLLADNSLTHNK